MDFSEKRQEVEAHQENVLNLPYLDSKEEKEEDAALAVQIVPLTEAFPSPTPQEQEEPTERDSSSKPKSQRVNQLLSQVYEMEILERELKRNNETLTKRNKKLHNSLLEMKGRWLLSKKRNLSFMKDNTRLYRLIRL